MLCQCKHSGSMAIRSPKNPEPSTLNPEPSKGLPNCRWKKAKRVLNKKAFYAPNSRSLKKGTLYNALTESLKGVLKL